MAPTKKNRTSNFKSKYYDVKHSASYTGKSTFLRSLKPNQRKEAGEWLDKQIPYLMHKTVPKKFKRLKVVAGFQQQVQGDLIDLSSLSAHNNKTRYLFTVVDAFSRQAFVETLLTKDSNSAAKAFEKILKRMNYTPLYFFSDNGSEFKGAFRKMLQKHKIQFYTSKDKDIKASLVERFNRTLMGRLSRYMSTNKTQTYIDVLQDIIKNYNKTIHSAIGIEPVNVSHKNKENVWLKLHHPCSHRRPSQQVGQSVKHNRIGRKLTEFKINDTVLIPKNKSTFGKGYKIGWTGEAFRIRKIRHTDPITYILEDLQGEKISGIFYRQELQKTPLQDFYEIESVLDTKGDKILVKWKNYPKKFNQWIPKRGVRIS